MILSNTNYCTQLFIITLPLPWYDKHCLSLYWTLKSSNKSYQTKPYYSQLCSFTLFLKTTIWIKANKMLSARPMFCYNHFPFITLAPILKTCNMQIKSSTSPITQIKWPTAYRTRSFLHTQTAGTSTRLCRCTVCLKSLQFEKPLTDLVKFTPPKWEFWKPNCKLLVFTNGLHTLIQCRGFNNYQQNNYDRERTAFSSNLMLYENKMVRFH